MKMIHYNGHHKIDYISLPFTMGLTLSRLFSYEEAGETRILMVGLDAAGKTSTFPFPLSPKSSDTHGMVQPKPSYIDSS